MRTKQDKTRRRIVEAAYESFWRSGFARASVDSIAERAGLTKRTLYSYFRSKDDLLAAVLQKYSDLAAERRQHIAARLPSDADGLIDSFFAQSVGRAAHHDGPDRASPVWWSSLRTCPAIRLEPLHAGRKEQRSPGSNSDYRARVCRFLGPERAISCC